MTPREPHMEFIGDREYPLALGPAEIAELERLCGSGIGAIARRLFRGEFSHREITETVRLALIGAGETPKNAAALVEMYLTRAPIAAGYEIAIGIMEHAWFGRAKDVGDVIAAESRELTAALHAEGEG
jgi:hypothetical protein